MPETLSTTELDERFIKFLSYTEFGEMQEIILPEEKKSYSLRHRYFYLRFLPWVYSKEKPEIAELIKKNPDLYWYLSTHIGGFLIQLENGHKSKPEDDIEMRFNPFLIEKLIRYREYLYRAYLIMRLYVNDDEDLFG